MCTINVKIFPIYSLMEHEHLEADNYCASANVQHLWTFDNFRRIDFLKLPLKSTANYQMALDVACESKFMWASVTVNYVILVCMAFFIKIPKWQKECFRHFEAIRHVTNRNRIRKRNLGEKAQRMIYIIW